MQDIGYTVHTFKEGDAFVAYVPELDVSSWGATQEDAMRNIRDAVQGFLESSAAIGSLEWILEESGYRHNGSAWEPPEFVGLDRQTASVA
jgi:predicted RNase H-like HicB family nuclease